VITFSKLKYGAVGRAAGLDVESCDFLQYCNDAVEQLMNRGNFWATVQPMRACVRDRIVTWPREVGTLLAVNHCDYPSEISNHWFEFMPLDTAHVRDACAFNLQGWAGTLMTESSNTSCVFNPIKAEGFTLRFFISLLSDVGKTITVYGVDVNGQIIRTTRTDGTVQDGVQLVLASPYVETPMAVRHVTRIAKDVTDGDINAFQWNVAGGFLLDLAKYQPTERNPEYITTRVTGARNGYDCNCLRQVSALVKLNFVPFRYDNDLVQIDCDAAIRDMVLAIRKKEQGAADWPEYEKSALYELNKQVQNKFPLEQFQVSFRPYGSARLQKRMRGFI
jgi:hypothetical protein